MAPATPSRPPDDHRAAPWHRDPCALGLIALLVTAFIIGVALAVAGHRPPVHIRSTQPQQN